MAAVSLGLVPETFTGEGRQGFSNWIEHFESIANVHGWDENAKRKWLRARLNGRAATVWRRLPAAETDTYEHAVAALKRRFEPASRKVVYLQEFQRRSKKGTEDWVSFGEDLRELVERAYPTLQPEAHEVLALNRFLDEIRDPQLAFGVRQGRPTTRARPSIGCYKGARDVPAQGTIDGCRRISGMHTVQRRLIQLTVSYASPATQVWFP